MLTQIIQKLIDKAMASGEPQDKPLEHGLYLFIRPSESGLTLTIYRIGVDPSACEWNTVIAFWPWKLGELNWTDSGITESGRHYKQVFIPNN